MPVYKGWHAEIQIRKPAGTGSPVTVGRAESASLDIASGLEPYYEIGDREAKELVEGNVEITGTLTRAWIDSKLIALLDLTPANVLADFDLFFFADPAKTMYVYALGCKAETTSFDITQDGFLMQDLDFRAKSWSYAPAV